MPGALVAIACIRIFLGYGGLVFARNKSEDMRTREGIFEERSR